MGRFFTGGARPATASAAPFRAALSPRHAVPNRAFSNPRFSNSRRFPPRRF